MNTRHAASKLLFTAIFASLLFAGSAYADTVYVSSCQALSSPGTTYVMTQDVVSPKPTVPYTDVTCFNVTASDVTLDCAGFTINGNATYVRGEAGVYSDQAGTSVLGCNIEEFNYGVHMKGASDFAIQGTVSTVVVNGKAIYVQNSDGGEISGCTATSTEGTYNLSNTYPNPFAGYALYLSGSSNIAVSDSVFASATNEGIYLAGSSDNTFTNVAAISNYSNAVAFNSSSHRNSIYGAEITAAAPKGKSGVYIKGGDNNTVSCNEGGVEGNGAAGAFGVYSGGHGTGVSGCAISGFSKGIYFNGTASGSIENVNALDGIQLYRSNGTQVASSAAGSLSVRESNGVSVSGFTGGGISLYMVGGSSVSDSSAANMAGPAILLDRSHNNALEGVSGETNYSPAFSLEFSDNNTISGCNGFAHGISEPISAGWGLLMERSSGNAITGCSFTSGEADGVLLALDSDGNTIADSTITGKKGGEPVSFGALTLMYGVHNCVFANNTINGLGGENAIALISPWNDVTANVSGNVFYNNILYNAETLLYIEENNTGNTFYWNAFNDAPAYIDDSALGNLYNTTVAGQPEGNIYANVMDGSVEIQGDLPSAYGSGIYVGTEGDGYPYGASTSGGKVIGGAVDYAPLTPYTATPPETATLTVTKIVVNNDSGTMEVSDFPLYIDNNETLVISGVPNTVGAGAHNVFELGNSLYSAAISGDCAPNGGITLEPGDVKECIITNDDIPLAPPPFCGDGICNGLETAETCAIDCAASPVCGNGVVEGAEECDDGNLANGDGCSDACRVEEIVCQTGADTNGDGMIDFEEVWAYINAWQNGLVSFEDVWAAINFWQAGAGC